MSVSNTLKQSVLCVAIVAALTAQPVRAEFIYNDFSSTAGLNLIGDALQNGSSIDITPELQTQVGAVWRQDRQQIVNGFSTTFEYQIIFSDGEIGIPGRPADGMVFVIQDESNTVVRNSGSALGYAGISPGVLVVEFDTYNNTDGFTGIITAQTGDPIFPEANVIAEGSPPFSLADGVARTATISYTPGNLSISVDGFNLNAAVDLSSLLAGDGQAYVGFTAATGSAVSTHRINSWSFTSIPEPFGDFDRNGDVDTDDWVILRDNNHTDLSGLSPEAAYLLGDLDGDLDNDMRDFGLFRDAYELANPLAGAFEAMLAASATVPEPSSILLLAVVAAGLGVRPKKRAG